MRARTQLQASGSLLSSLICGLLEAVCVSHLRSEEKSKVDSWTITFLLPTAASSLLLLFFPPPLSLLLLLLGIQASVASAFLQTSFESQASQLTLPVKGGNDFTLPAGPRSRRQGAEEQEKEVRAIAQSSKGERERGDALPDPGTPRSPNFDGVRTQGGLSWKLLGHCAGNRDSGLDPGSMSKLVLV